MTASPLPIRREDAPTTVPTTGSPLVGTAVRACLILALALAAAAHLPVIAPHLAQAPYMGVLFILLTVGLVALALCVLNSRIRVFPVAASVLCILAIGGYVATRSVAFPQLADDVGNWFEPLGVVSVLAEAVAASSAAVLVLRRDARSARRAGGRGPRGRSAADGAALSSDG